MGERFETLYRLDDNLYSEYAPIIVSACVLLKDTQTDNIITQIKFQSVSEEIIQAIKISVNAFDVSGKSIFGVEEYQYLDLNIKNGEFFGQNKAIIMPNRVTRSISIAKIAVVLSNGKHYEIDCNNLKPIDTFEKLDMALENPDIIKQYQIDISTNAIYVPQNINDKLWLCPCGQINSGNSCTLCHSHKDNVFNAYNVTLLNEHLSARLEKEEKERIKKAELEAIKEKERQERLQREREQEAKEKEERKKRILKYSIIGCIALVAIIIISMITSSVQHKNAVSEIDTLIAEQQYEHAFDRLNQSNIKGTERQYYLDKLTPSMKSQYITLLDGYKEHNQALNIDGVVIFYDDKSIYSLDEKGEKVIIHKETEYEEKYKDLQLHISGSFIYANNYILYSGYSGNALDNLKENRNRDTVTCINLDTGRSEIIKSYTKFSSFTKLQDGRIFISFSYYDDDIIFNPYDGSTKKGRNLLSESEKENTIYNSSTKKVFEETQQKDNNILPSEETSTVIENISKEEEKYRNAQALVYERKYKEAYNILSSISDYKNSSEAMKLLENPLYAVYKNPSASNSEYLWVIEVVHFSSLGGADEDSKVYSYYEAYCWTEYSSINKYLKPTKLSQENASTTTDIIMKYGSRYKWEISEKGNTIVSTEIDQYGNKKGNSYCVTWKELTDSETEAAIERCKNYLKS